MKFSGSLFGSKIMKISPRTLLPDMLCCFLRNFLPAATVLATLLFITPNAPGQTYQRLYDGRNVDSNPSGNLIQGIDGNFYGTTSAGGASGNGSVFKMTPAGVATTLVSFGGNDSGGSPSTGLTQGSDGNFYGTTSVGGANSTGTVFKVTPAGELTTLGSFDQNSGGGASSLVQGSDGNFYGANGANFDGANGIVFKVTPSGIITTLADLNDDPQGGASDGLALGYDGNFYGTTGGAGDSGNGTVFKITPSGALTTLVSFDGSDNGGGPNPGLILGSDGNFYGTTSDSGTGGYGTVYKVTTTGSLTTLFSFAYDVNGGRPMAGLVQGNDGNFYGTTSGGGAGGYGTVFKVTTTGSLTTLFSFANDVNGGTPMAGLVQGSDGNFYGSTSNGGTVGYGTIFKMTPAGVLTTVFSFVSPNGDGPVGNNGVPLGLISGSDGNFYGITGGGGANGDGTVFEVTPTGELTTLVSFTGTDGGGPGGLVSGSDGSFYGIMSGGGPNYCGTVFKVTSTGTLSILASFTGTNGSQPNPGLVSGTDGNFYGTTSWGGANGNGTVFKMTPAGVLTALVSVPKNYSYAFSSFTSLVQGSDGNFYGNSYEYPSENNTGGIFKVTSAGVMSALVSFSGTNGREPMGGLMSGSDGNLYGETSYGGAYNGGTVFKVTMTGSLTTLVSFTGTNGATLMSGLVQGRDGNFYGTTSSGGENNDGTIFKLTPAGVLTTLYSFDPTQEANPSTPVFGSDGCLYGTASSMVIWRLSLAASAPTVTAGWPSSVTMTGATLAGAVTANGADSTVTFQYGRTSSYGKTVTATPSPVSGANATNVTAAVSGLAKNTTYHFRIVAANSQGTTNGPDSTFATSNNAPAILIQPVSQLGLTSGSATFGVLASGSGTLTYQWFKNGAAIHGAKGSELTIGVGFSNAGTYTCVVTNSAGKVASSAVLLTVIDPKLLIYKVAGTDTLNEGAATTRGSVSGYLVLDRAGQQAAFLWTGKQGTQKIYWTEQRPDAATHSTGPVPNSTTLIAADTTAGDYPNIEHSLIWLLGTDRLINLSATDETVAPATFAGTVGRLTLADTPNIETIGVSLVVDKVDSQASRAAGDNVDAALNRLSTVLGTSYIEVTP